MTISDGSDRRNREGFTHLRNRYIRRAVAVSREARFRGDIDRFRQRWNQLAPRYRISPVASVDLLATIPGHRDMLVYAPPQLREDTREDREQGPSFLDWIRAIDILCAAYWPDEHFSHNLPLSTHPASKFVSACLFCSSLEVGEQASDFFLNFRVGALSLPYQPGFTDKWEIANLTGQVRFLVNEIELLKERLGESLGMQERRGLDLSIWEAGRHYASAQGISRGLDRDTSEEWWYIPLVPGMSTTDLRDAAGEIIETMREVYGPRRIDQMVQELRAENVPMQRIADLLGVSKDVVIEATSPDRSNEDA